MERLTKQFTGGYGLVKVKDNEQAVESEYPNTLKAILESWKQLGTIEDVLFNPDGTPRVTLERLAELVGAEVEGRIAVLPCKVGDTVFTIELDCKDNPDHSQMCFCWNKSCKECDKSYLRVWENRNKTADIRSIVAEMGLCGESGGFGKTVFLTREEAEAALKEGEENA